MSETKQLSFNHVMTVLMEKDDDERKQFIQDHQSSLKSVIKLVFRLILSGDKNEKIDSVKFLAKVSEVESKLILDNMVEDTAVYEAILKPIADFIHSNNCQTTDFEQIELIKYYCAILINVTRQEGCDKIFHSLLSNKDLSLLQSFHEILNNLINISSIENYDSIVIEMIADLLLNISRSSIILDAIQEDQDSLASIMKSLLLYFEKSISSKVRVCCISIIVNFLIPGSAQTTLLNPKLELVTKILFPLAGPTESEFDEEDMSKLPLDLQYLPPGKEREPNVDVRNALISCLLLCCNTRQGRDCLKDYGAYYILRELHKHEKDRSIQKRVEDVVDILIKEEEEYNAFPDLISIQVPEHLHSKFDEMDQDLLND